MGWKVTFGGTRRTLSADELEDPFASGWEGGTAVNLDELSPSVYDEIAAQEEGANWWQVYRSPCGSGGRMARVAAAAARHAGLEVPDAPKNMRESKALLAMFEPTEDIEDKPVLEGFPPKPPETANGSSSGLSDGSSGSLQTFEPNVSTTS